MSDDRLPPLPPSDGDSLNANAYDGFYDVKTKEFWGQNKLASQKVDPFHRCDHIFEKRESEIVCKKPGCSMGLFGDFDIRDGKLYMRGEPVKFT